MKWTYEPTGHKLKSTPFQHFVHLQQNAIGISPRVAITAVTLFLYWRMFALILLHDVRESLQNDLWTGFFHCNYHFRVPGRPPAPGVPTSERSSVAGSARGQEKFHAILAHLGPSVEQFFGIKLYHTVWWQYVVFKALNHLNILDCTFFSTLLSLIE